MSLDCLVTVLPLATLQTRAVLTLHVAVYMAGVVIVINTARDVKQIMATVPKYVMPIRRSVCPGSVATCVLAVLSLVVAIVAAVKAFMAKGTP